MNIWRTTRRQFLKIGVGAWMTMTHIGNLLHAVAKEEGTTVETGLGERKGIKLRRLGRTGLKVTEFGCGGHFTSGPNAHNDMERRVREINFILDQGVNFFDLQWDPEIEAMQRVLKSRPKDFYVNLRGAWYPDANRSPKEHILECAERELKKLGSDHADIVQITHMDGCSPPVTSDAYLEAIRESFEQLRQQGKASYLSFSVHEPAIGFKVLEKVDFYDVLMVIYNFLDRSAEGLIRLARKDDVGIIVMKPFASGTVGAIDPSDERLRDLMKKEGASIWQSALRWVLLNPDISTVVPGMHSIEEMKDDLVTTI